MFLFPPVVSVDEDKEVIGNLKVSLEAAKALTGIYQEFHGKRERKIKDKIDNEEEAKEQKEDDDEEDEEEEEKIKDHIEVIDYEDSDFY